MFLTLSLSIFDRFSVSLFTSYFYRVVLIVAICLWSRVIIMGGYMFMVVKFFFVIPCNYVIMYDLLLQYETINLIHVITNMFVISD